MRDRARDWTPLLVVAAATVLTLILAWPVVLHPTERIFGPEVVGRHHDPFTVMRQFAGAPVSPPYLQPATDWPGRALARIVPPVAAYNILILVTFPFSALTAYLFARQVTGYPGGSAIAGLAFAFAPFHVAHAAYHPHIAQVQWIPLFLLVLWQSVHRVTWPRAIALLATAAVAVLSNTYNVLLLAVIAPGAALAFSRMPTPEGERPTLRHLAMTLGILGAAAGVAFLGVLRFVPSAFSPQFAVEPRNLVEYGARWWGYLMPPLTHRWLGGVAREVWSAHDVGDGLLEQQVSIGWSVLALGVIGLIASHRSPATRPRGWGLASIALLAAICSVAPGERGWQWEWPMVWPSGWLYQVLPMFGSYARFALVVQLMAVVLAGIGATVLWRRRGTRILALALLTLLAMEYAPLTARSRDVLPTSAHRWLSRHAGSQAVFDCVTPSLGDIHTQWLAGFSIEGFGPAVADCGEPALATKLAALGYRHLIVRDEVERRWFSEADPSGLGPVYRGKDADVFEVLARPGAYLEDLRGFLAREYNHADSWRWSDGHATLAVVAPETTTRPLRVTLTLAAFGSSRHVAVSLDGAAVAVLALSSEPTTYSIVVQVTPGSHDLSLISVEPAVSPQSLGISADSRPLAFRLFEWTVE